MQKPHGPELGDGEELIGVRRQRNPDPRSVRQGAGAFEQTKIFGDRGENSGELLHFRRSARMPDAAIGNDDRPANFLFFESLGQSNNLATDILVTASEPALRRKRRDGVKGDGQFSRSRGAF